MRSARSAYEKPGSCAAGDTGGEEDRSRSCWVVTDVCLCEYTSHGHCGVIANGDVDNDQHAAAAGERTALSHVEAGADIVAPSDMMDGRVKVIRRDAGRTGLLSTYPFLSYSAKYASAF